MPFNSGKYQNLVRELNVEIVFVYLSFVEIEIQRKRRLIPEVISFLYCLYFVCVE